MIARNLAGMGAQGTADDYQRHYESEVSGRMCTVDGFRGARLLRCQNGQEVMFTSITFFTTLDAVRGLPESSTSRPLSPALPVGH